MEDEEDEENEEGEKKESASERSEKVHDILMLVLRHVMDLDLDLEAEPEEDVLPGEHVIGPASKEVICLYALWRKMINFITQSFTEGLSKIVDEVKQKSGEELEPTPGQRLIARTRHPQHIALANLAYELFKWAVVFDAIDGELHDKEIDLRKGWIVVWYDKPKEEEVKLKS